MNLARIEDGSIVIRLNADVLKTAWQYGPGSHCSLPKLRVSDPLAFAREVVNELNREAEDGSTRVHRMFDRAMMYAVEQGCEGVEEVGVEE